MREVSTHLRRQISCRVHTHELIHTHTHTHAVVARIESSKHANRDSDDDDDDDAKSHTIPVNHRTHELWGSACLSRLRKEVWHRRFLVPY